MEGEAVPKELEESGGGLDEAALAHYRDRGWVALGAVLDADEVAALRAEEERFRLPVAYGGPSNQNLFVNIQLCHRSEPVRRFCLGGGHLAAVRQLLGPDVCLTHQQFITKLPDGETARSDIPLHQDNGYGRLEPMTDVTVWVALVDTDARNGGLVIEEGSHRRGLLEHDQAGVNPVLQEAAAAGPLVELALAAGEAVAFSGLTLHGSGPNGGGEERPGLFVRYCEPHTKMLSEGGRPVLEDAHSWMVCGEA
ncbi:MAG: phytanoyl-CoA dioxygenase family protein [Myxococcota bacterium]